MTLAADAAATPSDDAATTIPASDVPTLQQYPRLQEAFDTFNRELFDGELTPCLITLQRRRQSFGYYSPGVFINARAAIADEIALNPTCFAARAIEENLAELVRHMCTHWTYLNGKQGREGYYNKAWAKKMRSLGLIPSGDRAGETGQRVTLHIDFEGRFLAVCKKLVQNGFTLPWIDRYPDEETLEAVLAESRARAEQSERGVPFGEAPQPEADMFTPVADSASVAAAQTPEVAGVLLPEPVHEDEREPVLFHPAETIYEALTEQGVQFPKAPPKKRHSHKVSYVCPQCEATVWGKPKLRVSCMDCSKQMAESAHKPRSHSSNGAPASAAHEPHTRHKQQHARSNKRASPTDQTGDLA